VQNGHIRSFNLMTFNLMMSGLWKMLNETREWEYRFKWCSHIKYRWWIYG